MFSVLYLLFYILLSLFSLPLLACISNCYIFILRNVLLFTSCPLWLLSTLIKFLFCFALCLFCLFILSFLFSCLLSFVLLLPHPCLFFLVSFSHLRFPLCCIAVLILLYFLIIAACPYVLLLFLAIPYLSYCCCLSLFNFFLYFRFSSLKSPLSHLLFLLHPLCSYFYFYFH